MTWGHQAVGLSNFQVLNLERRALACSGIKAAGRCRTIGVVVAYGLLGTPVARVIRETLVAWCDLINMIDE